MALGRDRQGNIFTSLDWPIIVIYLILMGLGWMSVCGASYEPDMGYNFLDLSTRSGLQIMWIASSILIAIVILFTDENLYDAFAYIFYLAFMVLLLITPFVAHEIKGSFSWIKIGPYSFQPAEFAKFPTALCLAKYISRYDFNIGHWRDLIATWLLVLLPMGLIIMQKETGCALVYLAFFIMLYREGMPGSILLAGISAIAYFVVGVRYADVPLFGIEGCSSGTFMVLWLIIIITLCMARVYTRRQSLPFWRMLGGGFAVSAVAVLVARVIFAFDVNWVMLCRCAALVVFLLYRAIGERTMRYFYIALFAVASVGFHYSCDKLMDDVLELHQQTRIRVLLGMEDDPRGAGYNVIQAKIAIGSGGLQGKGFLNGTQTKLKYVPEQATDFIFCTVGEEEGFAGCAAVLLLFLFFIIRLIVLAERQPDTMGRVYGYSVASIFLFHVFINVGMVLGLTPVIGIPLPFFSYGGSSLWGFTILLFIFLRMDAAHKRLRQQ
ncbi:MAG: rod shape-determining protein RodA [Prevotellaceae bacterium]|nr:rod shape-determining protein RodA [Prevotellaceae bacterium]